MLHTPAQPVKLSQSSRPYVVVSLIFQEGQDVERTININDTSADEK